MDEKAKMNATYNITKLLPNLIKDSGHLLSDNFTLTCSHSSFQDWIEKKCLGFIGKTNGHRIRHISVHWIIMCGVRCWDAIRNTRQKRPTLPSWRLPCYQYGVICHSSLIRQSCHFERDFDRVLLLLVDILTLSLNTERAADVHHWNVWSVDEKDRCAKFDLLLLNIQDATAR